MLWAPLLLAASTASVRASGVEALAVATAARSIQPGELVVFTITAPEDTRSVTILAFDHQTRGYRTGQATWQALVGIDLGVRAGTYPVRIEADAGGRPMRAATELAVRTKHFPTRVLRVAPEFVTPPTEVRDRIVREAAQLDQLWHQSADTRLWSEPFARPVPGLAVSRFGSRSVFNGELRSPHTGADFLSPTDTPIAAPNGGRVVLAQELYFSGNTVVIDHGLGLFSLLAHLSAINVREGDRVSAGQTVGLVGATGRVTGPHLHWAVRLGGARIDALAVLALLGASAP